MTQKTRAILVVLSLAVIALAALPAAGLAAKGGNGGGNSSQSGKGGNTSQGGKGGGSSNSLSLEMVVDTDGNGVPNHGETVTFNLSTTAENPYVNVRCYQGASFVYDSWAGFFSGAWFGQTFTLSSEYWLGGAADCTARLVAWSKNGREQTLASMEFGVGA